MALLELITQPGQVKTIADDGTVSITVKYVGKFDVAPTDPFNADELAGLFKGVALLLVLVLQSLCKSSGCRWP